MASMNREEMERCISEYEASYAQYAPIYTYDECDRTQNTVQQLMEMLSDILLYEELDKGNIQRVEVLMRNIILMGTGK